MGTSVQLYYLCRYVFQLRRLHLQRVDVSPQELLFFFFFPFIIRFWIQVSYFYLDWNGDNVNRIYFGCDRSSQQALLCSPSRPLHISRCTAGFCCTYLSVRTIITRLHLQRTECDKGRYPVIAPRRSTMYTNIPDGHRTLNFGVIYAITKTSKREKPTDIIIGITQTFLGMAIKCEGNFDLTSFGGIWSMPVLLSLLLSHLVVARPYEEVLSFRDRPSAVPSN